jgi:hypothetical protein
MRAGARALGSILNRESHLVPVRARVPVKPRVSRWKNGAPERSRTSDLLIRSQPLYPTELRARNLTVPHARSKTILRARIHGHIAERFGHRNRRRNVFERCTIRPQFKLLFA